MRPLSLFAVAVFSWAPATGCTSLDGLTGGALPDTDPDVAAPALVETSPMGASAQMNVAAPPGSTARLPTAFTSPEPVRTPDGSPVVGVAAEGTRVAFRTADGALWMGALDRTAGETTNGTTELLRFATPLSYEDDRYRYPVSQHLTFSNGYVATAGQAQYAGGACLNEVFGYALPTLARGLTAMPRCMVVSAMTQDDRHVFAVGRIGHTPMLGVVSKATGSDALLSLEGSFSSVASHTPYVYLGTADGRVQRLDRRSEITEGTRWPLDTLAGGELSVQAISVTPSRVYWLNEAGEIRSLAHGAASETTPETLFVEPGARAFAVTRDGIFVASSTRVVFVSFSGASLDVATSSTTIAALTATESTCVWALVDGRVFSSSARTNE